jgi:dipeptidyl aminopeptidase/acylaminoacyl peptidase
LFQKEVTGHSADEEPEWFRPFCPIQNVTPDYPPTLLIHGQEDTDVPCEKSLLMSQELERQGVEHQLITLPGRGHMFDRQGMQAPGVSEVFDQVLAFLEKQGMMS